MLKNIKQSYFKMLNHFFKWIDEKHRQVQFALTVVTLFLVIATFLMAGFMFWQTRILKNSVEAQRDSVNAQKDSIDTQKDSVEAQRASVAVLQRSVDTQIKDLNLSKRPYVYVEVKDVRIKPRVEVGDSSNVNIYYMLQADIEFKNEGDIPAVISEVKYYVTTDKDKRHLDTPQYIIDRLGSYPHPTIIFPKQQNLKFTYSADCSQSAERVYFDTVVSYEGHEEGKIYWYSFISKYATIGKLIPQKIQLPDGSEIKEQILYFNIIPLQLKGDWDKDANFSQQIIKEPSWEEEKKQIKKQREVLKE